MAEMNVFDRISELQKKKAERDSTASVKKGQIRPIEKTAADSVFDRMAVTRPAVKTETQPIIQTKPEPIKSTGDMRDDIRQMLDNMDADTSDITFDNMDEKIREMQSKAESGSKTTTPVNQLQTTTQSKQPGTAATEALEALKNRTSGTTKEQILAFDAKTKDLPELQQPKEPFQLADNDTTGGYLVNRFSQGLTGSAYGMAQTQQLINPKMQPRNPYEVQQQQGLKDSMYQARMDTAEAGQGKSPVTRFAGDVVEAAGQQVPNTLIGLASGGMGTAPAVVANVLPRVFGGASMLSQVVGNTYDQTLREGKTHEQALTYGLASGILEGSIESLFSGMPGMGKGVLDGVTDSITKKVLGRFSKLFAQKGLDMFGEGTEEFVTTMLEPLVRKATIDPNMEIDWRQTLKDAAYSFLVGAGTAGLMQSPGTVREGVGIAIITKQAKAAESIANVMQEGKAYDMLQQKPVKKMSTEEQVAFIEALRDDMGVPSVPESMQQQAAQNGSSVTFTEDQAKDFIPVEPSKIVPEQSTGTDENIPAQNKPVPVQRSYAEELDDMIRKQQSVVEDIEYRKNYLGEDVEAELAENTQKLNDLVKQKQDFISRRDQRMQESEQARQFEQGNISDYLRGVESTPKTSETSNTNIPAAEVKTDAGQAQKIEQPKQKSVLQTTEKQIKNLDEYAENPYADVKKIKIPQEYIGNENVLLRVDEKAELDMPEDKPHGLYMSFRSDGKSIYTPYEGDYKNAKEHFAISNIKNPLVLKDMGNDNNIRGGKGLSGGVMAVKTLDPDNFDTLNSYTKQELKEYIGKAYPSIKGLEQYYDRYELMEVLGAQLSKDAGYDSIITTNETTPVIDEIIILKNSAIKQPTPQLQQQTPSVPEQTTASKPVPVQPSPVSPKQRESFDTRYKNTMTGEVKSSSDNQVYSDKPVWEMGAREYLDYVTDDLGANREEAGMNYDSETPQNKLYVDLKKIEDKYLKKTQGYRKMQYANAGIPMPKNNYEANKDVLESDMYKKINEYEEKQKEAMSAERSETIEKYKRKIHGAMLNDAIDAGKTIPENILQDYPFLRKKYDIMRAKRGATNGEKVSGTERIPVAKDQTGRGQSAELQGKEAGQGQVIDTAIQGEDVSPSLNVLRGEVKQPHSVGNTVKAYDNDNNEYEFSYALVSADDLISSHDTDMNINQQYPQELQPRDRTRISSKAQIEKMAGSIQPELLGENPKISDGAPIIGPDNIVESGNGRVIALKKMYQSMKGKDTTYQEWLRNNAEKFGLDPDNLPNNPVLVRVRKSDVDRNEFVKKANETSVALMSSTETAKSDAERLNDRILEMFVANEDGVINTADNRPFISAFTGEIIPSNELGRYITPEGYLSQDGLMRVRNAIFYKAYGSDKLLTRISESTDNNIKNITNSLINIAPQIVSVKNGIQKGSYFPIDYASDITAAVEKFVSLKENKTTVEEYLRQLTMLDDDMTASSKAIMYIMEQNSRSAKKLTEFLNTVLNAVEELGNPNQVSIFEDQTNVNKEDVLYYAYRRFEDSGQESFGTNTESKSGEGGEVESILRPQNGQKGTGREKPERKINNSGTRAMTSLATESEMPQGNSSSTGAKTVDDIIEIIENTVGVPVRTGKFRQRALGIFKVMPEVIRTKVRGDLPVIMHELGHYYDKKHKFSDSKAHEAELMGLGRRTSRPSYSKEQIRGEGVAEFMRLYMINPAEAKTKAPQFFAEFENQISKEELAFFTELRRDVLKIVNLPSAEKVINTISMGESRKTIVKQSSLIRRFIDSWINSNAPFERAQQEAEDAGYTGGNLARAAELYRGMEGKIMNMFTDKQRDLSGNPVFKSLQEILEPISAKATKAKKASPIQTKRDFVSYAISKRAMDYKDRNLNMPLPWFVYENTIQEMEAKHPEFVDVFSDLRQWEDNSLQWLVDSGIKTQREVEVIKQMNVNHMPLQRIQEALEVVRPGSGASMGQSKDVVKRAVGSGATIIDPLESIISNAFIIYRAAEANKTLGILHDMAKKVEGIGDLVEIVPTGMKGTTFTVEEIRAQLYKMAKANKNSDLADVLSNLSDEEMETAISVFRPLMTERDREITYYNNGKKVIMQVETELYKAIKGLNNTQTNPIIKALNIPKRVLQFGVVTTVDFMMRNMVRDTSSSSIQSEVGISPLDIMRGYISAATKDKSFRALIAAGGGTEYFNMNDRTAVQKIEDDALGYGMGEKLNALGQAIKEYKESKNPRATAKMLVAVQAISKAPFDFIRNLVEFSEMGPRVAEFEKALKKGYSEEEAASFARKVTQDFRRSGYTGKEVNKIVAFFNANIQGTTRVIETFAQHPGRTMLRGFLYITLPTLLLYGINHDDEEYKRLPDWRKSLFWNIPIGDGKFIPIPKPYGYGWVFGALPEITLDKILNDTPDAGKRILDSMEDNFNVPLQMSAMTGAMEVATNKSWNKTPIEGTYDRENKPAYLIRNTRTSTLAKTIGDMLKNEKGLSPKQIDYLVKSYFGTVGEFFWRLPDTFKTGIQAPQKIEDYPIIKKFVVDSTFSNESTNKLYDYQEELRKRKAELKETGEYKAVKHLPEKAKENALKELDNLRIKAGRTIDDISELRKEITDIEQSDINQAAKDDQIKSKQQEINRLAETYNAEYEALKKKYHIR